MTYDLEKIRVFEEEFLNGKAYSLKAEPHPSHEWEKHPTNGNLVCKNCRIWGADWNTNMAAKLRCTKYVQYLQYRDQINREYERDYLIRPR
tara:strand:- start:535 stop:807 length:273 start_codon:yes stop_codon:yes gene_type:complete